MLSAVSLIILGGILNGLFAYPMKLVKGWRWENIWFLFGVFGLVIFPCMMAVITIPRLFHIYSALPCRLVVIGAGLGVAWGGGSVLFGLGISALGLSLGYAIIIGTAAVVGTVIPALAVNPELVFTGKGMKLLAGLASIVAGLTSCSIAGRKRDVSDAGHAGSGSCQFQILENTRFLRGLTICFLSGVLSACFNIGFALTQGIIEVAVKSGASESAAPNAVWALVMTAGFVPSALYCLFLFKKHGSLTKFGAKPVNWAYACLMGVLWIGGVNLYGRGAAGIGSAGATLGWPVLMAATIITANLLGLATAEWSATAWDTKKYLYLGILMLIVAVFVIGSAGD